MFRINKRGNIHTASLASDFPINVGTPVLNLLDGLHDREVLIWIGGEFPAVTD
jgi:hypothetical protein